MDKYIKQEYNYPPVPMIDFILMFWLAASMPAILALPYFLWN